MHIDVHVCWNLFSVLLAALPRRGVAELSILRTVSSFLPASTLKVDTDGETEAQRDGTACLMSNSFRVSELGFEPQESDPQSPGPSVLLSASSLGGLETKGLLPMHWSTEG